jgi:hypothetical protein
MQKKRGRELLKKHVEGGEVVDVYQKSRKGTEEGLTSFFDFLKR